MLQKSEPVSVSLADGSPLVLAGMSDAFDADSRFSLVATSATAEGFLGAVMRVPVDVGIVDWNLPAIGGRKLVEILRDQPEAPRMVVYGDSPDNDIARMAMVAGAAGFVSRTTSVEELLDTCAAVANGQMMFPFLDVRTIQLDPINSLTKRERALVESLSSGKSNKELAHEFNISLNTVKFHLTNTYHKLGVKNRTQAIAYFFAHQNSWTST